MSPSSTWRCPRSNDRCTSRRPTWNGSSTPTPSLSAASFCLVVAPGTSMEGAACSSAARWSSPSGHWPAALLRRRRCSSSLGWCRESAVRSSPRPPCHCWLTHSPRERHATAPSASTRRYRRAGARSVCCSAVSSPITSPGDGSSSSTFRSVSCWRWWHRVPCWRPGAVRGASTCPARSQSPAAPRSSSTASPVLRPMGGVTPRPLRPS